MHSAEWPHHSPIVGPASWVIIGKLGNDCNEFAALLEKIDTPAWEAARARQGVPPMK
jgi:hypothetical protein